MIHTLVKNRNYVPKQYTFYVQTFDISKRPQPETVLAPVSYRSSRRRRQRKRLLLKVPNGRAATTGDAVNQTRGQTSKGVLDG